MINKEALNRSFDTFEKESEKIIPLLTQHYSNYEEREKHKKNVYKKTLATYLLHSNTLNIKPYAIKESHFNKAYDMNKHLEYEKGKDHNLIRIYYVTSIIENYLSLIDIKTS